MSEWKRGGRVNSDGEPPYFLTTGCDYIIPKSVLNKIPEEELDKPDDDVVE